MLKLCSNFFIDISMCQYQRMTEYCCLRKTKIHLKKYSFNVLITCLDFMIAFIKQFVYYYFILFYNSLYTCYFMLTTNFGSYTLRWELITANFYEKANYIKTRKKCGSITERLIVCYNSAVLTFYITLEQQNYPGII